MIAAQTAGVPVAWLVARAAGLVSFALLTIAVTLGLALSTKILRGPRAKALFGWHQTLVWTALAMLVLHGGALAVDPVMRFGLAGVLLPGGATWRPVPVAAGIVTGWLMLALAVSFHVRRRIGQRRWRLMHYASFAAFATGLYHALNVGTDFAGTQGLVVAGVFAAPVVWLIYARILIPGRQPRLPRRPEAAPSPTSRPASSAPVHAKVPA